MKSPPIPVDAYVFDVLMRDLVGHDHSPSSFLVFLCLWRLGEGKRGAVVQRSLQQIVAATGLSKSAVQQAIRHLKRRKLIRVSKSGPTGVPKYVLVKYWE